MFLNSSLYLTCFKCFLKDYLVYIKIYSSVCVLKSNTHIHTYRHKHICPSTVLFRNMLSSNTFLQYSLGLTRITGCLHAITTKHQFSLKNIYGNLNSFQVYQYFFNTPLRVGVSSLLLVWRSACPQLCLSSWLSQSPITI